jgi:hypothetical protein
MRGLGWGADLAEGGGGESMGRGEKKKQIPFGNNSQKGNDNSKDNGNGRSNDSGNNMLRISRG